MREKYLRALWSIIGFVALSGCNRIDNTPNNSLMGPAPKYQVIIQDLGDPAGIPDLGFESAEIHNVLGLGGEPWQSLVTNRSEGARTLVNDPAGASATFEQSAAGKVTRFRAQSGSTEKCGDGNVVAQLINAAAIGINPPITLSSASTIALRYPLFYQGRTSVSTNNVSIETGSDGCIHWIEVRRISKPRI